MNNCPHCHSPKVENNKMFSSPEEKHQFSATGRILAHSGHPYISAIALVVKAVDYFIPAYKCTDCKKTFNVAK